MKHDKSKFMRRESNVNSHEHDSVINNNEKRYSPKLRKTTLLAASAAVLVFCIAKQIELWQLLTVKEEYNIDSISIINNMKIEHDDGDDGRTMSAYKNQTRPTIATEYHQISTNEYDNDSFDGIKSRIWKPYNQTICYNPGFDDDNGNKSKIITFKGGLNNDDYPLGGGNGKKRYHTTRGILFIKPMKVGGTTATGINIRLSKNLAKRLNKIFPFCENNYMHSDGYMFENRHKNNSFLWSMLRDPTNRAISHYFFHEISRQKQKNTITNFRKSMLSSRKSRLENKNYYINLHSFNKIPKCDANNGTIIRKVANNIIQNFDFIAITERFDESMIILKMLLNLTIGDMLYVNSAKSNGGYDDGAYGKCTHIQPTNLTKEMQEFIQNSQEWNNDTIKWDLELYKAANKSLDLTIDSIGRELVQHELNIFKKAQVKVKEKCMPLVKAPCTETGEKREPRDTNCLFHDGGCAYECLDEIALSLSI